MKRAIFLDRDGTLVYPCHYPSHPRQLRLYNDICPELGYLQQSGFSIIIITNQSGLARGYFTKADLEMMHDYLVKELTTSGIRVDAIYYCPHHPEGVIPELAVRCNCRKPQPGMLLQAAGDLQLDLSHSWVVGDFLDDVEAGNRAGCHTILVDLGTQQAPKHSLRFPNFVAPGTLQALKMIRVIEELSSIVDLTYRPISWLYQQSHSDYDNNLSRYEDHEKQ